MKKARIIWLLSIYFLVSSCEKRKYADEKVQLETEDIYCTASIGGEDINLKIGKDGYYCYSSYTQNSDSIYVFKGDLKKFDCNPCPLSLQIQLTDYRKSIPGSSVSVDSSFRTGSRNIIPGTSKYTKVRFVSHSNKDIESVKWNFENGTSSQTSIFDYEFGQEGVQTVSLTIQTKDNCKSMVVNKIFISDEGSLFASYITANSTQNTSVEFKANIIGGKPPFRYTWSFGDGSTSNETAPTHTYDWTGSYPVKLKVEDANNTLCESNYIHVTYNDNSSCAANMTLSYLSSRNAFLNGVKIQFTDPLNSVLKSDNVTQPAESYFEVLNSKDYPANERGETGRLLTVRFNVLLSDKSRTMWFKSENTAIAVTYK